MLKMNSRERILAALKREEVDRVPAPQIFWKWVPKEQAFTWKNLEEEILWLKQHDFDPYLNLPLPVGIDHTKEVALHIEKHQWIEESPDKKEKILGSEWSYKDKKLSAKVRITEDYPFQELYLFSDFNTARFVEPLIKKGEDMLTLIEMDPFPLPQGEALKNWKERCKQLKKIAQQQGLALACYGGCALDYLIWSSLADQAIMLVLDYPAETKAFLEYLNSRTETMVSWCIEEGVDFIIRRGWYDSADFWGPQQFSEFAAPFIKRTIDLAHQAELPCVYVMCTGINPLLKELEKLSFDCLWGIEPVCTGQDLKQIKATLGNKCSFCTGLSAPLHIGLGTPEKVREAVQEAFKLFGRRGFLFSAVPSIRRHWPWENVLAMIDEYKKLA